MNFYQTPAINFSSFRGHWNMPLKCFTFLVFIVAFALISGMDDYAFSAEGTILFNTSVTLLKGVKRRAKDKGVQRPWIQCLLQTGKSRRKARMSITYISRDSNRDRRRKKRPDILKELGLISDYDVREISDKIRDCREKQEIPEKAGQLPKHKTQKAEKKSAAKPETAKKSEGSTPVPDERAIISRSVL